MNGRNTVRTNFNFVLLDKLQGLDSNDAASTVLEIDWSFENRIQPILIFNYRPSNVAPICMIIFCYDFRLFF